MRSKNVLDIYPKKNKAKLEDWRSLYADIVLRLQEGCLTAKLNEAEYSTWKSWIAIPIFACK